MRRARLAAGALFLVIAGLSVTLSGVASATSLARTHPLGNFTTNTYAGLIVRADELKVAYVVDLAEIPTVQAKPRIDTDGNGKQSRAEEQRYAKDQCARIGTAVDVTVGGRPVRLRSGSASIRFLQGQAGLRTLRLDCPLSGSFDRLDGSTRITFDDTNFADNIGWREITADGDGTTLVGAKVPRTSVSKELTAYPKDRLSSPLRQRSATLTVRPGGRRHIGPSGNSPVSRAVDSFESLVSRKHLTLPFGLLAVVIAFFLGSFHALAPGHGKTVMAAYLVGQRGSRRHALLLGVTVAITHTGGVFALALVVSNSTLAPDRLYPWFGAISGLMVIGIGVGLLVRAVRFRRRAGALGTATRHGHGHPDHEHAGHEHTDHDHEHAGHEHPDHEHASHEHSGQHVHGPALAHAGHHGAHATGDVVTGPGRGGVDVGAESGGDGHRDDAFVLERGDVSLDSPGHAHTHSHGGLSHSHPSFDDPDQMRPRNMMALGFAGGLVPSPSALVVLVGAIALGRAWFGMVLISAYGAGMAATLVLAGLLLERARGRIERMLAARTRPRLVRLLGALPVVTSVLVLLGGVILTLRAIGGV